METTAVIYRIMLLGHIGAAIVGFGALIAHGSFHAKAVRSSPTDAEPVLRATAQGARVGEYGLYAVLGFGIVLVALSDDVYRYSEPWISAAFVIWFVIIGLIHGLVRPARTRLLELASSLNRDGDSDSSAGGDKGSVLVDQVEAQPMLARLAAGEAGTQLLLLAALVLMIWKPGH